MTEEQRPLIGRMLWGFGGGANKLYLDGNLIYTTPNIAGQRSIKVFGTYDKLGIIDIGTGDCCNGYFQRLRTRGQEKNYKLDFIMPVDFVIHDLLFVHDKETTKHHGDPAEQSVLATGHGCDGAGIRLLGLRPSRIIEILSAEEYHILQPHGSERPCPRFKVIEGKIYLDMSGIARRFSPERDPRKPSLLHDRTDQEYVVGSNSMDLTQRLIDTSIDIEKTLELAKDYSR